MAGKTKCFVIMPFSGTTKNHTETYWSTHYSKFLKPLIERSGALIAEKSAPIRGDLLKQIISDLVSSPIVVADLTDYNPNVLWELGVRQSFRHGTITIAEFGTKLPFDLTTKATLYYHPTSHLRNAEFEDAFLAALKDCQERPDGTDSQVLETISGRGAVYQVIRAEETRRRLDAALQEMKTNAYVIKRIKEIVDENTAQKKKSKLALRFRSACLELLLTNRYLDESPGFYDRLEKLYGWILAGNDQLAAWHSNFDTVQGWLPGFFDTFRPLLAPAEESLLKAQQKLMNQI